MIDNRRRCWYCVDDDDALLIWGGDQDCEPEDDHLIVTNLTCSKCNALYLVYWGESGGGQSDV